MKEEPMSKRYNYDDIINLPYHKSDLHPWMSAAERAAQFLPFAALTGYDDGIKETARLTDQRIILSEDAILSLNERLEYLYKNIQNRPEIDLLFFKEDKTKSGGSYIHIQGSVKKIDEINNLIIMDDKSLIPLKDIIEINIEGFNNKLE